MLESELMEIDTDIEDVTIIHPVKKAYRNLPLCRTGKSDNSLSEFTMSKPTSETTLESESMPIDSNIEDVTVVDPVKKAETEGNDYPPLRHTGKSDNSPSEFTMSRHTSETTLESKRMLIDPESEPEQESVSLEVADHEYDEAIGDNNFILEEDDSELTPRPTKKGDKYYLQEVGSDGGDEPFQTPLPLQRNKRRARPIMDLEIEDKEELGLEIGVGKGKEEMKRKRDQDEEIAGGGGKKKEGVM
jgi:hypothetical protein